jgi:hypothetical protein
MIFAKLDVLFWRHKKFVRAGPEAAGYWAAALAYLREDSSEDGVLSKDVIGQLLGLGVPHATKLCKRLCEVGLFESNDRGYELLGYAEKNETRKEIDARRAIARERKAAWRLAHHKNNVAHVPPSVTELSRDVSRDVSRGTSGGTSGGTDASCPALVPGSGSGSGSGSGFKSEIQRDPEIQDLVEAPHGGPPHGANGAAAPGRGSLVSEEAGTGLRPSGTHRRATEAARGPSVDFEIAVERTQPITQELRGIAELAGVQDVPGAWLKFTGHNAGRVMHVPGRWQAWCVDEAKRERSERERLAKARLRAVPTGDEEPSNAERGRAERLAREAAERQARKAAKDG